MDDQIIYVILCWMLFRQRLFRQISGIWLFFYYSVHENEKSARSMR